MGLLAGELEDPFRFRRNSVYFNTSGLMYGRRSGIATSIAAIRDFGQNDSAYCRQCSRIAISHAILLATQQDVAGDRTCDAREKAALH